MSGHHEWASARYTIVQGTAKPGEIERGESANDTAAIEFVYGSDGDSLVIEGRPEELLALMRRGMEMANAILLETVRTPELRRMYGDMAEASQLGTEAGS